MPTDLGAAVSSPRARRDDATTRRLTVVSVLGTRPEVIQAAALSAALRDRMHEVLVNTGQHYDANMDGDQIVDTGLGTPSYNLGLGAGGCRHVEFARRQLSRLIAHERPDAVIVRGDTDSALAGARAASDAGVPLVHVEAGLRSFSDSMPEERNRVEIDHLADLLIAPTETARRNLERDGAMGTVHVCGDVLLDMLMRKREHLPASHEPRPYALATIHRAKTTDDLALLARAFACLAAMPSRVILLLHPRTRARLWASSIEVPTNVEVREPVTYSRMLALERDAAVVLTDSGGVQREAYMWGVPCITLRDETEWVETVETGWNTLVGLDSTRLLEALARPLPRTRPSLFGDGRAAQRIAGVIEDALRSGSLR